MAPPPAGRSAHRPTRPPPPAARVPRRDTRTPREGPMTTSLTASIGPAVPDGQATAPDCGIVLRIANTSATTVVLLNPALGKPSPEMEWPWSVETYRAALLLSYGFLELTVAEATSPGRQLDRQPLETWATPVLRPPVVLQPGESVDVPVP